MALPFGINQQRIINQVQPPPILGGQPNQALIPQQLRGNQLPQGIAAPQNQIQPLNQNQIQVGPTSQFVGVTQQPERGGFKPVPEAIQTLGQPQLPAPTSPQPQFGLAGGEQALQAGLGAQVASLEAGTGGALNTLQQAGSVVGGQFGQGIQDLIRQNQLAQQQLGQTQAQSGAVIRTGINQAVSALSPFRQTGQQAQSLQAARLGILGPEAQAQAFTDFQDSPGQQFLREQGELGVINQAAALGGLGGGRVRRELTRFGTGLASQNLAQENAQLAQIAGQGLQAAGQASSLLGQGALSRGDLISNIGGRRADLTSQLGGQQLGARTQLGGVLGNIAQQGAGFQQQAGLQASNVFGSVANQLANARVRAGQDIGQGILGTTRGLSQLAQQQGAGTSDILGSGAANISNLLTGAGQLDAAQQQQLAQLLSNLTTGEVAQLSNLQQQIGQAEAGGILGRAEGLRGGLSRVGNVISGVDFSNILGADFTNLLGGTTSPEAVSTTSPTVTSPSSVVNFPPQ